MVFVGMIVDVSNVFFNTILQGNENITQEVMKGLLGGMKGVIDSVITWISALGVVFIIPFSAGFAQLALVTGLRAIFITNIFIWTFQIICCFFMSSIFDLGSNSLASP